MPRGFHRQGLIAAQNGSKTEQGLVIVQDHIPKVKVNSVWFTRLFGYKEN